MAYSDDQKAVALAVLAAVGGNYREASRRTGIHNTTIMQWDRGEDLQDVDSVLGKTNTKKVDLADMFEDLARRLVGSINDSVIEVAPLAQRMTGAGIAIDKMRLLREQPTPDAQALAGTWQMTAPILANAGIELDERDTDDTQTDPADAGTTGIDP